MSKVKACRNCGSRKLSLIISLGNLYPSSFIKPDEKVKVKKLPLELVECDDCRLVQLAHNFDLDMSYRQYWYQSALNKSMVSSLQDIVTDIESRINLFDQIVVDIGTNDGTLLSLYGYPCNKVGFDPALNLKEKAMKNCDIFVNDYFSKEKYPLDKKASVITAIAMFYDLPNVPKFVQDIKAILDEKGIFVIQLTDLYSMLVNNDFMNICHEHLEYYSLRVLRNLFKTNGLELFDCSYNDTNGGSLRCFVGFPKVHRVSENVTNLLDRELKFFFQAEKHPLLDMMVRVEEEKSNLLEFLYTATKHDKKIFISGASTKGNTLLQYYGIDNAIIPYALEVNPDKFGLYTLGSNVKIISEKEGLEMNPDYLLVLPWVFKAMLVDKYYEYLKGGGKLLFPLPNFTIEGKNA